MPRQISVELTKCKFMLRSNLLIRAIIISSCIIMLWGCVTTPVGQVNAPFDKSKYRSIRIDSCVNRSEFSGSRDIAKEATIALQRKIEDKNLFRIMDSADLIMTCDFEKFSEGSAIKRWFIPGSGVTRADISVIIWEKANSKILATFKSQTEVSSGGLYTIGADSYVIGVALDGIVEQLQEWVKD